MFEQPGSGGRRPRPPTPAGAVHCGVDREREGRPDASAAGHDALLPLPSDRDPRGGDRAPTTCRAATPCAHVAALQAAAALIAARADPRAARRAGRRRERLGPAQPRSRPSWRSGPTSSPQAPPSAPPRRPARPARSPSARPTTWSVTPTGSSPSSSERSGLMPHVPLEDHLARARPRGGLIRRGGTPRVGPWSSCPRSPAGRPSERRAVRRTVVVWDALDPVLLRPARRRRHRRRHRRLRRPGRRARPPRHRRRPQPRRAGRARPAGARGRGRGRRRSRATCPRCSTSSAPASADVVLCHGVLEVVDDPAAALATIREVLRPGGTVSLLVAQRTAAVLARAMAGHFRAGRSRCSTTPLPRGGPVDASRSTRSPGCSRPPASRSRTFVAYGSSSITFPGRCSMSTRVRPTHWSIWSSGHLPALTTCRWLRRCICSLRFADRRVLGGSG